MARENIYIKTGTYTGNATVREITGVGFEPTLVIIKGVSQYPVFRNKAHAIYNCSYLDNAAANLATSITHFTSDGFYLGTSDIANKDTIVYYYIAMRGTAAQAYLRTGKYFGDGNDNRNFITGGVNFTPDIVFVKEDDAVAGALRTNINTGDSSGGWNASFGTNKIQNLQANGFQIGTNAAVNAASKDYYFAAMKKLSGAIYTGSYVGTGSSGLAITGLNFTPSAVVIKDITGNNTAVLKTTEMGTDVSALLNNSATNTTNILSLDSDGFTVGSTNNVNQLSSNYMFMAFKSGSFVSPITRTSV